MDKMSFVQYKKQCTVPESRNITDVLLEIYDILPNDDIKETFELEIMKIMGKSRLIRNYGFLAPETLSLHICNLYSDIQMYLYIFSYPYENEEWIKGVVKIWNDRE